MRTKLFLIVCVLSMLVWLHWTSSFSRADDQKGSPQPIIGIWQGNLAHLRIIVKVSLNKDAKAGSFTATLDSPDEKLKDLELNDVTRKGDDFHFQVTATKALYDGKISKNSTEITGTWKQSGLEIPVNLEHKDKIVGIERPQLPKKPYPYNEEEVIFENKKAGHKLAGTLTLPKSGGPFPAVLLIAASGPLDRDDYLPLFDHQPFLVIADYLTRRGIAVLRFDKRGIGKSTGKFAGATTEDFAQDVEYGIEFLKARKDIDSKRIGLMGHSEGGTIAPMVAARSKDVAFIVMLAGSGLPGEELFYLQGQAMLKAKGVSEKGLLKQRTFQEKAFAALREEKDLAVAEKKIKLAAAEMLGQLSDKEKKELGDLQQFADDQARKALDPWWRFAIGFDPRPTLRKVQCPVLAINGDKDVQCTYKENLAGIEKALKEGGNKDYTVQMLPGLNHFFQTCETGSAQAYNWIEETFAPPALELIGDWIVSHTRE